MWERVGDRTELQHIDLPTLLTITAFLFCFSELVNWGPRGPASLGAGFLYRILSSTHLIPNCSIGVPTFSTTSRLQNSLNFLCSELYISPMPTQSLMHFRHLWNGVFDRHRVEITVMQFTGHFLPMHQFVIVPWDVNPVPYCQPSSSMPMEYALPPSLEWHVWPGRRSIYYKSKFRNIKLPSWLGL